VPLPRPLTPRGRVAVAAPASAALDASDAHAGIAALRDRGLTVEPGRAFVQPDGFLSGPDDERAGELNRLFARDDLDAVVCLRGGYGVLRLLDRLDYDAARATRPLVVGYSDITALHLALLAQAGLPGLSGPMVAPDWPALDAETEAHFWRLAGGETGVSLAGPGAEEPFGLQDGDAEGVLVGGNLSLVAALVGTPFLPDLTGAILVVEDVGEAPYRIDGLLARLRLAGVLERLGGLVFGMFTGADPLPDRPSLAVEDVLDTYAEYVDGPVAAGLTYGHVRRKVTLPIGVRVRLTVDGPAARLVTLSPVTESPA
jgi:muramoyltetrapeptide carboxypeptidase